MATLYHWDTPLPLEHRRRLDEPCRRRNGSPSTAPAAGKRFGDRVAQWVTLNEPASVTLNGYALGVHAPGHGLLFDALPSRAPSAPGPRPGGAGAAGGGRRRCRRRHEPAFPRSGLLPVANRQAAGAGSSTSSLNRLYADPILLGNFPRPPLIARPGSVHWGASPMRTWPRSTSRWISTA